MTLLSRSFVAISLAAAISVPAPSFAFAQEATSYHPVDVAASDPKEHLFMIDSGLAWSNMDRKMIVKPTGNIDRDFVAMMIAQHQGALGIARAELKYGQNDELRHLAENIITQQQRDIAVMRHSIGEASAAGAGDPSTPQPSQESVSDTRPLHK